MNKNIKALSFFDNLSIPIMAFIGFMIVSIISLAISVLYYQPLFAIIPVGLLLVLFIIKDYTYLFYSFFVFVPFSIEYNFTPTLGTDLPSEPLMWAMFGLSILIFCRYWQNLKSKKYINLITGLLVLHVVWIGVSCILSAYPLISLKVFLAKLWYVIPFYFLALHILTSEHEVSTMIKSGVYMLSISIVIILYRHSLEGFSFEEVNFVVSPLFRNHVGYACIIVIFLPYLWLLYKWARIDRKLLYLSMLILFAVAIYFSYTRAAIIAMVASFGIYYIIEFKLLRIALLLTFIVSILGVSYMLFNNNYLTFTPNNERAITHKRFDRLIEATYEMEDISTMERVYRWVAGVEMIKDKPILGFGPGTFYNSYKAYTVNSFRTYVSNNPDQSTVHCYFLLVFIEQGLIGFLIFMSLCIVVLLYGDKRYHSIENKKDKQVIMAAMLSFCIIMMLNLINDMIETDKVGPFFFLSIALIGGYKAVDNLQ